MTPEKKDWRALCTDVANERDSVKVLDLVEQLIAALDERTSNAFSSGTRATGAAAYN
jgi:hypothetical protein